MPDEAVVFTHDDCSDPDRYAKLDDLIKEVTRPLLKWYGMVDRVVPYT